MSELDRCRQCPSLTSATLELAYLPLDFVRYASLSTILRYTRSQGIRLPWINMLSVPTYDFYLSKSSFLPLDLIKYASLVHHVPLHRPGNICDRKLCFSVGFQDFCHTVTAAGTTWWLPGTKRRQLLFVVLNFPVNLERHTLTHTRTHIRWTHLYLMPGRGRTPHQRPEEEETKHISIQCNNQT